MKRPSRSFSRNDPVKSTAGVFKNDPDVVFEGRFRGLSETTAETPGPPFSETGLKWYFTFELGLTPVEWFPNWSFEPPL
jgi:hypothetical protein